jgi:glycosyltransferase involved in cell wall biosynthesis
VLERSPVPQRVVIVAPTVARFHSRTYRIARTLAERGHTVTVVARAGEGEPGEEHHPSGYRIVRVRTSTIDGVPFSGIAQGVRSRRRRKRAGSSSGQATVLGGVSGHAPAGEAAARRARPLERLVAGVVRRLSIPLYIRSFRRAALAVAPRADLVHGMAFFGIPVAAAIARRDGARLTYDATDIYLEARNLARLRGPLRWLLARAERGWARRADRVVTVNEPYAAELERRLGVSRPLVVMNCPFRFTPPRVPERRFHAALDLPPTRRVVLYHGGLEAERGIEQLLDAVPRVRDATLVLMGYGSLAPALAARAEATSHPADLRVLPAVRPEELLGWVACADVVAMPIQPTTLNHRLATPNKLFEGMAAGVPVLAADLPGMAPIVSATGCGILVDPADPHAIATGLTRILDAPDEERAAWGRCGLEASRAGYAWEVQGRALLDEFGRLTGRAW